MNLQSIKQEFLTYLQEKLDKEGKDTDVLKNPELSIFQYGSEFLEFAKSKMGTALGNKFGDLSKITISDLINNQIDDKEEKNYIPSPETGINAEKTFPEVDNNTFNSLMNKKRNKEFDIKAINGLLPEGMKLEQLIGKDLPIDKFADEYNHSAFDSINDIIAHQQSLREKLRGISQNDLIKSQIDTDKDGEISEEEQEALINMLRGEDGLLDEGTVTGLLEQQQGIRDSLTEAYNKESVIKAIDIDGDGKLNDEEKAKFEEYLRGEKGILTRDNVDPALKQIQDGTFKYENKPEDEIPEPTEAAEETPVAETVQEASSPQSVSQSGGGGDIGNYTQTPVNNTQNQNSASEQNYKSMSLEELQAKKTEKEGEVQKAQDDVNAVYSGENENVKKAQEECDKQQKIYDEAVEKDENIDDETKKERTDNLKAIADKEKEISGFKTDINNKEGEIKTQEGVITSVESNISALSSSISELEAQKSSTDDSEKSAEIEQKIAAAKAEKDKLENETLPAEKEKLEGLKKEKEALEKSLTEAEGQLQELEKTKADIEEKILKNCTQETKDAMEAYNKAKEEIKTVQDSELTKAKSTLETKQKELDEINTEIDAKKAEETKNEYSVNKVDFDFDENLTDYQKSELETIKKIFEEHKEEYEKVAEKTGIPAELICAIHYREGSCDFSTYLHNGDKLGKTTTHVPAGIYFDNWTDAAVDALTRESYYSKFDKNDVNTYYEYAERYNGLGYRNKGLASPYVWSGTTKYTGGMYVADHQFSATAKDKRVGVAVILKSLMNI